MIEAYAFLAAFMAQILAWSVLFPAGFIRYARARLASFPAERVAQLYSGIDIGHIQERYLMLYRALNIVIALLGVLLLGWLFSDTQRPDWNDETVKPRFLVVVYTLVQMMLPFGLLFWFAFKFKITWLGIRFNEMHERAVPDSKRTATLQRRRLFDFVSPFTFSLAVLAYCLFVAFVIYIQQHPFRGFAGAPFSIGAVTLIYALNALVVYRRFYGKKINPLETQADNFHRIGYTVKVCVYSCIVVVAFVSLFMTLKLLHLERWMPVAMCVAVVLMAIVSSLILAPLPRQREAAMLGPSPAS